MTARVHLERAESAIMAIVDERVAKATSELQTKLAKALAERDEARSERDEAVRHWEEWLTDTIDRATSLRKAVRDESRKAKR